MERRQVLGMKSKALIFSVFFSELGSAGASVIPLFSNPDWFVRGSLTTAPYGGASVGSPPSPYTYAGNYYSAINYIDTLGSFYYLNDSFSNVHPPPGTDGHVIGKMTQIKLPDDMHYIIVNASGFCDAFSGVPEIEYPDLEDLYNASVGSISLALEADGLKGDIITIPLPGNVPASIPAYPANPAQNIDGYGVVNYFVRDITWADYKSLRGIL